jgi:hypothetical protein
MRRDYYMPRWMAVAILAVILLFILSLLSSCYTERKARGQFSRAAVGYPIIAAEYCAMTYPPKDTVITGQTVTQTDTLWADSSVVIRDTIRNRDTVYIHTVERLPGQVITRTVLRTDTVFKTNTAAVDACNIALRAAVLSEQTLRKERDKWRAIARKRWWIIFGMGAVITLGLFGFIRKKLKP